MQQLYSTWRRLLWTETEHFWLPCVYFFFHTSPGTLLPDHVYHEDISGGIAQPLTSALDGGWVVSFTPRPIYPRGRWPWYPFDRRLAESQGRSGRCGEQQKSLMRLSARSLTLYRLTTLLSWEKKHLVLTDSGKDTLVRLSVKNTGRQELTCNKNKQTNAA
jgi:hypothetical protein